MCRSKRVAKSEQIKQKRLQDDESEIVIIEEDEVEVPPVVGTLGCKHSFYSSYISDDTVARVAANIRRNSQKLRITDYLS